MRNLFIYLFIYLFIILGIVLIHGEFLIILTKRNPVVVIGTFFLFIIISFIEYYP